ncbi:RHS repeat protein [Aceticella autotrophica]|uniref:RHS repeat protein n=1 Tax=Aceticella autotrophica TaxID=2755338 RepID=A0A975GAK8_9THEO|nr:RHS repeat-associated core domain-containing protein [Aceticella autotrophica]QSZ27579.1 RHS repeat protein [Aceticella autotrophica]
MFADTKKRFPKIIALIIAILIIMQSISLTAFAESNNLLTIQSTQSTTKIFNQGSLMSAAPKIVTGGDGGGTVSVPVVYNKLKKAYSVNSPMSPPTTYGITVNNAVYANVYTDKQAAPAGGTVTINISDIKPGYQFKSITVKDSSGSQVATTEVKAGQQYTFTMPASAVIVSAEIEPTTYGITVNNAVYANVYTDKQAAPAGDTVTINISDIKPGYQFKSITVKDSSGSQVATTEVKPGQQYTFTMPASAVIVSAEIEPTTYGITVNNAVYANVYTDNQKASAGDTVTINISDIKPGYQFKSITVKDSSGSQVATTEVKPGQQYTFIMPGSAVTVEIILQNNNPLQVLNGSSRNVGIICNNYNIQSISNGFEIHFSDSNSSLRSTDYPNQKFEVIDHSKVSSDILKKYDTLLLFMCNPSSLTAIQKQNITDWIKGGGKLIIWDSDAVPEGESWDYTWLGYPFKSNCPGQTGSTGLGLHIVEENQLSSNDPNSPYYIDTNVINSRTDAVGDSNVMVTYSPGWFIDMLGENNNKVKGPVHAYAFLGSGLIIYSGLDWDDVTGIGYGLGLGDRYGVYMLKKILMLELNVVPGKTVLPCSISGKDAVDNLMRQYPGWFNKDKGPKPDSRVAEPINTATGAHELRLTMLSVKGTQPISLDVCYNSLLLNKGPIGKGWDHNFETYLEVEPSGDVIIHWDANHKNTFVEYGKDQFAPQDISMRFNTLRKNIDGSYVLTCKDQTTYTFNSNGQMIQKANGHGQSLEMTYDSNGHLATVKDSLSGQGFNFHYNTDGLIDNISDTLNRKVLFVYDVSQNLLSITDAEGKTVHYSYNEDGRILTSTDADGKQIFSNTYDDKGRVIAQDDGVTGNQIAHLNYDETSDPGKLITTYTNRNGKTVVYTYDQNYNMLSLKNELGLTTIFDYDASGNLIKVTDSAGKVSKYIYDTYGNLTGVTDPAGNTTKMTYDDRNNLTSVENTAGKKIIYTYDANNNPISITDPFGNITSLTYDTNGMLQTVKKPGSGIYTIAYQNGLVKMLTDPVGNTITYGYDAAGRPIKITDAAGKAVNIAYDNCDRITSIIDPMGNKRTYSYDSRGNMLNVTDPNGNVTHFSYNGNNKLTNVKDALGNVTKYEYDGEDRLIKITDAYGNVFTLTRDEKGRIVGITDPTGRTQGFQYDNVDNLLSMTDANGAKVIEFGYDMLNNPVTIKDALGNTVTNRYDNLNRLIESIDQLGRKAQYIYDDLNRLVSSLDAVGGSSSQSFDADGNKINMVDPNGNKISFKYDKAGRLIEATSADGCKSSFAYNNRGLISESTNGRGQKTTYNYDDNGRLVSFTDQEGTVSYTYDANGNVLTVSDANGISVREYDALNRVVKYTDGRGNTIHYVYDAAGNLITLAYPDGKEVHYQYDAANRLTKVTDWANRTTTYQYDNNGRLMKALQADGSILTMDYDSAGHLIKQTDVSANGNVIAQYDYTYDAAGNLKTEDSAAIKPPTSSSNTSITYTAGNRITAFNGRTVQYDDDGNMTYGPLKGLMVKYSYNSRNQLVSVGGTSYIYDAEGNRIALIEGNNRTDYIINPEATLSQVLVKKDSQGRQTYYIYGIGLIGQEEADGTYHTYHYDMRGSTIALTDQTGKVTDEFSYAPYGELSYHKGNTFTPFLYNGRDGVMTDENGLYYMRNRYYNTDIKRFINQDYLIGSIIYGQTLNRYAYVNGNPVLYIDPNGNFWGYDDLVVFLAGGVANASFDYIFDYIDDNISDSSFKPDYRQIIGSFILGGIGALAAYDLHVPILKGPVTDGIIGLLSSIKDQYFKSHTVNWKDALLDAGISILGGISERGAIKRIKKGNIKRFFKELEKNVSTYLDAIKDKDFINLTLKSFIITSKQKLIENGIEYLFEQCYKSILKNLGDYYKDAQKSLNELVESMIEYSDVVNPIGSTTK